MIYYKQIVNTFFWLLWRDLRVLGKDFINNILDVVLLPTSFVLVSGYILPYMGLPAEYGALMLVSSIVGMCLNSASTYSGDLVTDLDGPKNISYELTLPVYYWIVYIKMAAVYMLKAALINIFVLPWGILLLKGSFDLSKISILKFMLIYPIMNVFFGFFTLLIAVIVKDTVSFGRFWIRWGWQIFVLAGWQFSWFTMHKAFPNASYINLFNPLVYTIEGMRAAILGQEGYINFWFCCFALIAFTAIFAYLGLRIFKKRLDCV